jgi:hypothetical protein
MHEEAYQMRSTLQRSIQVSVLLTATGSVLAGGPVIDIPPLSLPSEAFFSVNPSATVNVSSGEVIFPGELLNPFGFNGATVNIEATAQSGFFTVDHYVEDVTYNINGGDLLRAHFVGSVGSTFLNINSGAVERGLWLNGNTVATMSGGTMGVTAGGQPAMTMEDDTVFTLTDGVIDDFIILSNNASLVMSGGTIEGALHLNDNATAIVSGGTTGRDGRLFDIGNVLTVTGGTLGRDFVIEQGVVNMSGGAFDIKSAILNGAGGVDPIFNMSGGALGDKFRAYDGTINISGGLVGGEFRLGTPTGDGSGVTMNLTVKSATLGGIPLDLSTSPTTIFTRGGVFLSCILLDDSLIGFTLNEDAVFGEDRIRAAAVLTIALAPCPADLTGEGDLNFLDVSAFLAAFAASDPIADFNDDGSFNFLDVSAYLIAFGEGCP